MLSGYKTYITAGLMIAIAVAKMTGIDVPGFSVDPGSTLTAAVGLIFARMGAKSDVAKVAVIALALMVVGSSAFAADLKLVRKANPLLGYTQGQCGAYFGINTSGTASAIQGGPIGAQIVQGDVGGTLGYGCPIGTEPGNFWFVEVNADWANFNGATAGLGMTGPFHGELRAAIGSPLSSVLNLLPNGNPLGGLSTPAAPLCPSNVTCGNQYPFLFGALHVQDIGGQFGLAQNREYLWYPGIGIGLESRWSNKIVNDVWAQVTMQSTGLGLGPLNVKLGNGVQAGTTFKF